MFYCFRYHHVYLIACYRGFCSPDRCDCGDGQTVVADTCTYCYLICYCFAALPLLHFCTATTYPVTGTLTFCAVLVCFSCSPLTFLPVPPLPLCCSAFVLFRAVGGWTGQFAFAGLGRGWTCCLCRSFGAHDFATHALRYAFL